MIEKVILNPDENLSPVILTYSEEKEDYVLDIPDGITRYDLISLVEEIKRITDWEE